MKILLLQNMIYVPTIGGANKANRIVMEHFAATGRHTARAVVPAFGSHGPSSPGELAASLAERGIDGRAGDDGMRFESRGVGVHAAFDAAALRRLARREIEELEPDWVLVSSEDPGQDLLALALLARPGRIMLIVHTPLQLPFGPNSFLPSDRGTELVRRTAGIVCMGDYIGGYLRRHGGFGAGEGGPQVKVIGFPVYGDPPFRAFHNFDAEYVTLVNPCTYKGISIFLELARRMPEVAFAGVPTWGTTADDHRRLAELPNVHLLEPRDDIEEILERTRVLLMPSLWMEAMPLLSVETLLRGVPIVASDVGGLANAMLGADFVLPVRRIERYGDRFDERQYPLAEVPEQDVEPWHRTLERLLTDQDLYERVAEEGRAKALDYVGNIHIRHFEVYLERLGDDRPDPAPAASGGVGEEKKGGAAVGGLSKEKRALLALRALKRRRAGSPKGTAPAKGLAATSAARSDVPEVPRLLRRQGEDLPLSFAQERLWILDRLFPGNPFYNSAGAVRLRGELDRDALALSLGEIVRRHEVLRTTFHETAVDGGPGPVQRVAPSPASTALPITDLGSSGGPEAAARRAVVEEARRPFDLERGPPMRARLWRLGEGDYLLSMVAHHVVCDGWSLGIFVRELMALYRASGDGGVLPPLPIQYADFAAWQRRRLTGELLDAQLAYWRDRLAPPRETLELPYDRPRPATPSFVGGRVELRFDPSLGAALARLAEDAGATLYAVLLAAFDVLLYRYTGETDVLVGTAVANRNRSEIEGVIGFFVNTLVMRIGIGGDGAEVVADSDPRFRRFLGRVHRIALDAQEHQDLPFERVVEELQPERRLAENPLFRVMFVLQNAPVADLELPGLRLEPFPVDAGTHHFDLSCQLGVAAGAAGALGGHLEYSAELFDVATIERLAGHFEMLLWGVAARPQQRLSELPLLTAAEHRQLAAAGAVVPPVGDAVASAGLPAAWWRYFRELAGTGTGGFAGVHLLDRHRSAVPRGVVGEIHLRLDPSVPAVVGAPRESAARLVPVPLWLDQEPGSRLLATGDLGRWRAEGGDEILTLEGVGAADRGVWLGDERIDLGRVEASLVADPRVADAAVAERTVAGGSVQGVVAHVVPVAVFPASGPPPLLADLLPASAPSTVVEVARLPLDDAGRVDRGALARLPVLDDELARRWQEWASVSAGGSDAAVLVEEVWEEPLELALDEFLGRSSTSAPLEPAGGPASLEAVDAPPAWSQGEPLELPADAPDNLGELLERAAREAPERGVRELAGGGERRLSYPELLAEAGRLLGGLGALGAEPGSLVIVELEDRLELLATVWGCLLGGLVPMPLAPLPFAADTGAADLHRLGGAWSLAEVPFLVTGEGGLARRRRELDDAGGAAAPRIVTPRELRRAGGEPRRHHGGGDRLALLFLTSGSTGRPKAVQLSHRNVLSSVTASSRRLGMGAGDVTLNWMPLDHVGSVVRCAVRDAFLGCEQLHAPTPEVLADPLLWLEWIEKYRVSFTWAPNFAFALLLEQRRQLAHRRFDLSSLRVLLNTGEAVVPGTARRCGELLSGHGLPADALWTAWGMSETSSGITFSNTFLDETTLDSTDPDRVALDAVQTVELGPPIAGTELRVVDIVGEVVSERVVGRLQARGATLTPGYYRRPDLDREALTGDGWFCTGDLALLHRGRLVIRGRESDVVIVRGLNVHAQAVEAAVSELEGVAVGGVAVCAARRSGADTDELAVFFTAAAGDGFDAGLLEAVRRRVMERFAVQPGYVVPLPAAELDRTSLGKVRRAELARRFAAGDLDDAVREAELLAGTAATVPAWFYRSVWRRRRPRGAAGSRCRSLIFAPGEELGGAVARRLGDGVVVTPGTGFERMGEERFRIDPRDGDHYRRVVVAAGELDAVFHLWGFGEPEAKGSGDELDCGPVGVLALARALAEVAEERNGDPPPVLVAASHSQVVADGERCVAERAGVPALLRSLAAELPGLRCRHLDLPATTPVATVARRLAVELADPGGDPEVAWRGEVRRVPRLVASVPETDGAGGSVEELVSGGLYLVTGGLGGVGQEVCHHLLDDVGVRLLIVGRTPLDDSPDRWRVLAELEAVGEVRYRAVDVADEGAVAAAVAAAEAAWGARLVGVFHLAGVERTVPAAEEDRDGVAAVFRAKAAGTRAVAAVLAARGGGLLVPFASVNGWFGGFGVAAYAAANGAQRAIAREVAAWGGVRCQCLLWSAWEETGMSRGRVTAEAARARGFLPVSRRRGVASLRASLRLAAVHGADGELLIGVDGGAPAVRRHRADGPIAAHRLRGFLTGELRAAPGGLADRFGTVSEVVWTRVAEIPRGARGEVDRELLTAARVEHPGRGSGHPERVAPRDDVERRVAAIWAEVLGREGFGIDDNFFHLGGYSLLAAQVIARTRRDFGVELPLSGLFESPTVRRLAAVISAASWAAERCGGDDPGGEPVAAEREVGEL